MELYCKKCNHKLTVMELQQVSSDKTNLSDQATLIDPGLYVNAREIEIYFEQQIDFLVNKQSIILHNHKDRTRLTGCCGPGDLSVLNQVCPNCNTEIGVIIEDCWLPHFIGISEETVSKKPLW
ncbi:hypothetical protein D3C71_1043470 [compost metagenome]